MSMLSEQAKELKLFARKSKELGRRNKALYNMSGGFRRIIERKVL